MKSMKISKIGILLFLITVSSIGDPIDLSDTNFESHFNTNVWNYLSSKETPHRDWFIMFMAPWCGHCNRAKPAFTQFANQYQRQIVNEYGHSGNQDLLDAKLAEGIQIAIVDCTSSSDLCQYFGIRGYPTFIYLTANKTAIQYKGPRTEKSFLNFTHYHNPEVDSFCQVVQLDNGFWKEVKDVIIQYWPQVLILGLILPSAFGFFLGNYLFKGKGQKANKNKTDSKQSQQQVSKQKQNQKTNDSKKDD